MRSQTPLSPRLLVSAAALFLGGACILEMAAGPTPTPQVIVVPGDGGNGPLDSGMPSPTPEPIFSLTPTWTFAAQPTGTAPVTLTAGQDLSCVKGPHWILYEWVARVNEGETVPLLAKSEPDWPDYFFARKSSGEECWIFGNSSTISGDAAGLPVREAPPLPKVTYTIENKTELMIHDIFIRPKGETAWGANRMANWTYLYMGASFSLDLTAGFYDVRILDFHGGVIYEAYDRAIGSEPSSQNTVLNLEVEVYFQSNYPFEICTFSFQTSPSSDWKDLRTAADGPVATGQKVTFKMLAGDYSLKVFRCTGEQADTVHGFYIGPAVPGYIIPLP